MAERLVKEDHGQTLVLFALMLTVLLGFVAMVTDAGMIYANRRSLQDGVDGAALAAATYLTGPTPVPTSTVLAVAQTYANDNGISTQELNNVTEPNYQLQVASTLNTNDTVIVSARRSLDFGLRYLIGGTNTDIVATASAIVVPVNPGPGELWPWAILAGTQCTIATPCKAKVGAGGSSTGNFGSVSYPTPSICSSVDCSYENLILIGYPGDIPMPTSLNPATWNWTMATETGDRPNQTTDPVDTLFSWDAQKLCNDGKTSCAAYYEPAPSAAYNPVADGNTTVCIKSVLCPRVRLVSIMNQSVWPTGTETVGVQGFACVYITQVLNDSEVDVVSLNTCLAAPQDNTSSLLYGAPLDASGVVSVHLWH